MQKNVLKKSNFNTEELRYNFENSLVRMEELQ